MTDALYNDILSRVQQPAQYTGGEWNAVAKDHASVDLTFALAFPDTYPIGMSHLGIAILYEVLNRQPRIAAERAFMPLADMQAALRAHSLPLVSLETRTPLTAFDAIGFSLQYELCFTNVLAMLDLAGIPVRSEERGDRCPLIMAGGQGAMSPEPLAPFIDLFAVGDGEEMVLTLAEAIRSTRGMPRRDIQYVPADVLDPRLCRGQALLYYTGMTRLAKDILARYVGRYLDRDRATMATLRQIHRLALRMAEAMRRRDLPAFGQLIGAAWELHKQLNPEATNEMVEVLMARVRPHVHGARIVGAGSGGFLLMVCKSPEDAAAVRRMLDAEPPNGKARFFDFGVSRDGLAVTAC